MSYCSGKMRKSRQKVAELIVLTLRQGQENAQPIYFLIPFDLLIAQNSPHMLHNVPSSVGGSEAL